MDIEIYRRKKVNVQIYQFQYEPLHNAYPKLIRILFKIKDFSMLQTYSAN